ncbi:RNA 2'-phosphotransferase [Urbifossiella limnaea]|uniref:Probable RNA 2'-phosphotransferase n=1 Tax=Urbifossiella limnaea TaxID=2528023 RepID=A0A517XUE6_9BACT|nr:RNA 2'-phosphotransferase [Urbifossiella limnaea]QDU21128.1 RNA 2'-phosphotransferase [Urbifossiella limnaea]
MDRKRLVRLSKFLSLHLRHQPAGLGLTLEPGGWVPVADLIAGAARVGFPMTPEDLDEVVRSNDKQRFALDTTGTKVRANQGHSADVDLQLEPAEPPAVLYHGTADRFLDAIRGDGLLKMARHHVHLSADTATAAKVGTRHGRLVVLEVNAAAMRAAGYTFYRAANGVWLADAVPPEYLRVTPPPDA